MPSSHRQKKAPQPATKPAAAGRKPTPKTPARADGKGSAKAEKPAAGKAVAGSGNAGAGSALELPLPGGRRHVLSLSFVRDGDEFMARLETDAGHITELKNRSLDQLLTLVASELEDLLE